MPRDQPRAFPPPQAAASCCGPNQTPLLSCFCHQITYFKHWEAVSESRLGNAGKQGFRDRSEWAWGGALRIGATNRAGGADVSLPGSPRDKAHTFTSFGLCNSLCPSYREDIQWPDKHPVQKSTVGTAELLTQPRHKQPEEDITRCLAVLTMEGRRHGSLRMPKMCVHRALSCLLASLSPF